MLKEEILDFIVCIRCKGDPIKNSIPHMLEEHIIAIDEE